MYTSTTQFRIHYALTDQMGFCYYGNYAQLYEIGRTESIRQLGFTYKEIEAAGVIMPVIDMQIRFLRPARYDDLISIKTTLREMPAGHKIIFYTEVFNEANELLNTGSVTLYFMEAKSMQRSKLPAGMELALQPYFAGKD